MVTTREAPAPPRCLLAVKQRRVDKSQPWRVKCWRFASWDLAEDCAEEEDVDIEEGEVYKNAGADSILQFNDASRSLNHEKRGLLSNNSNRKGHSVHSCAMYNKQKGLQKETDKKKEAVFELPLEWSSWQASIASCCCLAGAVRSFSTLLDGRRLR